MTACLRMAALAALALALPFPAGAQAPPAVPAATAAPLSRSMVLARVTAPLERHVDMGVEAGRQAVFAGFQTDAEAKKLLEEYPGIDQVLWTAAEPVMRDYIRGSLPDLWVKLASSFEAGLTSAEIDGLIRFYSSPIGQKIISGRLSDRAVTRTVEEVVRAGGNELSEKSARALASEGNAAVVASMSAEEHREVSRMLSFMSMEKLAAVGREVQRITLQWTNEPTPELDARLEKVAGEAVRRYVEEHPKR